MQNDDFVAVSNWDHFTMYCESNTCVFWLGYFQLSHTKCLPKLKRIWKGIDWTDVVQNFALETTSVFVFEETFVIIDILLVS